MSNALSPRRPRQWIGFFVVLTVLAAIAVVVPLVYNLNVQLRPEQLLQARQRWREHEVQNYDLEYIVKLQNQTVQEDRTCLIRVRSRQVVLIVENGEVIYLNPSLAGIAGLGVPALSQATPEKYVVAALFNEIEAALHRDESSGRRNFVSAQFDPKDGHPQHYVHRDRSSKERVEWHIRFTKMNEG